MLNHSRKPFQKQDPMARPRYATRGVSTSLIAARRTADRRFDRAGRHPEQAGEPVLSIDEVIARVIAEQPPQLYRGEP